MKEVQKKITIMIWCCSLAISALAIVNDYPPAVRGFIMVAVFSTSLIATLLYFMPISEHLKAILVLLLLALATLATSIFLNGNSGTFITSFIVLAMAALYFEPSILMWYTIIYLSICTIITFIDKVYIIGTSTTGYMAYVLIITYAIMAFCLNIATKFGNKYMMASLNDENEAHEKSRIIEAQSATAQEISQSLSEHIKLSDEEVKQLYTMAQSLNSDLEHLTDAEATTITLFQQLNDKINNSSKWIEENYTLIDQLTNNYEIALEQVKDSKDYSDNAQVSITEITSAIQHAYQSIKKSSEETGKIGSIVKDINEIASQTNLLAINASIEAARVGDKGSGFDIVAEQIRTLSVQSKQASETINQILESLNEALGDTLQNVSNGMDAIKHGGSNLDHMVKCVEQIDFYSNQSQITLAKEVEAFEEIKDEFSAMVREVEKSTKTTTVNMAQLEEVVQATKSQTESTRQVLENIEEMEQLTVQIINQFNTTEC
ncbi:MAG: methyl-accepting chemotaxis protein [bacterium]|nr:methyl-accepting chemotaxis protein [bacterium]